MDRLESMSMLVAVADAGSLSAAGRRLGVPLTTVSRKISELETHLGTELLKRSSRRIVLTDAGAGYIEACKRILEQIGEAERAATGEYRAPRGELMVTAPIVFGRLHLLPVIGDFLKAYPEIAIRLIQSDRNINLLDEHIDLALRIGALPDSSLMAMRLGTVRRVVCASPAYFAERGMPTTPADLGVHDCITSNVLTAVNEWQFEAGQTAVSVSVRARLFVSTAEAAIDAAIAGLGVTRVLSYQSAQAVRDGRLVIALQPFEPAPLPVSLLYGGGRLLPLKLRAFLDFAAPRLRERLAP
jgi:DNA-binding transcriptional LysR family regulator